MIQWLAALQFHYSENSIRKEMTKLFFLICGDLPPSAAELRSECGMLFCKISGRSKNTMHYTLIVIIFLRFEQAQELLNAICNLDQAATSVFAQ